MASGSVLHDFQGDPASSAQARDTVPAREGLLALTRDEALVNSLRTLGSEYETFTVSTESDFASHLLSQSTGVAILDASAVASAMDRLTERLRAQFPELVLIVAGGVDDQSALATQITNGTVYRFLHKPVSEQRVRLFVEAAWRRHGEEHAGIQLVSAAQSPTREATGSGSNLLLLGGAAITAIVIGALWWWLHKAGPHQPGAASSAASEVTAGGTSRDDVLEDLLARAAGALSGGALVAPPGASAADLYRQAQQRRPSDPRGANGLEKVIDRLLSTAEAQLLAQHLEEAQRLTDQARAIKPDHVRAAFLMAQIAKERERAVLAQARQAASSGDTEQALSVLEGASAHSSVITEARQELQQKRIDERVRDYLRRANERMRGGELLEPVQDNAGFYIESARALAPENVEVKQTREQFLTRLVSEAHKSLAAGNAQQGERWTQAAMEAGVAANEIAALKLETEHVRASVRTDALARLALLVNERLSQGRVLDPTADSAKYYLTQLEQADPAHPSTQGARHAFAGRALEEAKSATGRQDYAGAQRWLSEAHEAGADQASINAINETIRAAQQAATQAPEVAPAAALRRTHYVPPEYPAAAQKDALSGWVDVDFTVNTDGSVSDITVTGAQPRGVFEQPAMNAVRKWRYQPFLLDGQPINQRARVRVRFALQQ
jgi:TonB family protein